jgi:hypothetical protein
LAWCLRRFTLSPNFLGLNPNPEANMQYDGEYIFKNMFLGKVVSKTPLMLRERRWFLLLLLSPTQIKLLNFIDCCFAFSNGVIHVTSFRRWTVEGGGWRAGVGLLQFSRETWI